MACNLNKENMDKINMQIILDTFQNKNMALAECKELGDDDADAERRGGAGGAVAGAWVEGAGGGQARPRSVEDISRLLQQELDISSELDNSMLSVSQVALFPSTSPLL